MASVWNQPIPNSEKLRDKRNTCQIKAEIWQTKSAECRRNAVYWDKQAANALKEADKHDMLSRIEKAKELLEQTMEANPNLDQITIFFPKSMAPNRCSPSLQAPKHSADSESDANSETDTVEPPAKRRRTKN
jgi:hypothetical protein